MLPSHLDSRDLDHDGVPVDPKRPVASCGTRRPIRHAQEFRFSDGANDPALTLGFYERESWGVWSRVSRPVVVLRDTIEGLIALSIDALGFGPNVDRLIDVRIGTATQAITLTADPVTHRVVVFVDDPTSVVTFDNLITGGDPSHPDPRSLGIGLRSLVVEPLDVPEPEESDRVIGAIDFATAKDLSNGVDTVGFYPVDRDHLWTQHERAHLILRKPIPIPCRVEMTLQGYWTNAERAHRVRVGDQTTEVDVGLQPSVVSLVVDSTRPTRRISFLDIDANALPGSSEPRTLGLAVSSLRITPLAPEVPSNTRSDTIREVIHHPGVELPDDLGRCHLISLPRRSDTRHWLIACEAFIFVHRSEPASTLLVLVPDDEFAPLASALAALVHTCSPVRCRIIVVSDLEPLPPRVQESIAHQIVLGDDEPAQTGPLARTIRCMGSKPADVHVPGRRHFTWADNGSPCWSPLETTIDWGALVDALVAERFHG